MFESIMVRRTTPMGAPAAVDLGRLAEAMLFYQRVYLALTRASLHQFILGAGPDLAIELVENGCVDAVFLDRDFAVLNEGVGTPNERHRPATITVMTEVPGGEPRAQTRQDLVYEFFNQALDGQQRKARRKANRFLNQVRDYEMPGGLQDIALREWQREQFMRDAVRLVLAELAPGYTPPADLRVALVDQGDGLFRFESNIDWAAARAAQQAKTGVPGDLGPGSLLVPLGDMTEDLHLGASLDATLAQDPLGAELLRAKCSDLRTAADLQQFQIDAFQDLVVHGVTDIPDAINSGARSFEDFLKIQATATSFRQWLDGQPPDADLVKRYSAEVAKRLDLLDSPLGKLRWLLPVAVDGAASIAHPELAAHLSEGLVGYGTLEHFVVERYIHGWRPSSFVDQKLRAFVNG